MGRCGCSGGIVKMRELPLSLFRYFVLLSAIYTSPFGCDDH